MQMYSIHRSALLKRKYEEAHGFRYNWVIRTRFDVRLTQALPNLRKLPIFISSGGLEGISRPRHWNNSESPEIRVESRVSTVGTLHVANSAKTTLRNFGKQCTRVSGTQTTTCPGPHINDFFILSSSALHDACSIIDEGFLERVCRIAPKFNAEEMLWGRLQVFLNDDDDQMCDNGVRSVLRDCRKCQTQVDHGGGGGGGDDDGMPLRLGSG